MERTLRILIMNRKGYDLSTVRNLISMSDFQPDFETITRAEQINSILDASQKWDIIFLAGSNEDSDFTTLTAITNAYPVTPVIFFTDQDVGEVAASAMNQGAVDCISITDTHRLMPVLKRELTRQKKQLDLKRTLNQKEILSNITDSSTEQIFLFNTENFSCYYANRSAIEKSGYSQKEINSLSPGDIYAEYSIAAFRELMQPLLVGERETLSLCTNIKRKMGVVYPAETTFKYINKKEGSFILATNKDISGFWYKIQKLKRQRNLTEKYIRKNNRKNEFLADAAHDMRTSINSIILSNKLLAKQKEDTEKGIDRFINAIYHSGSHLLDYIDEFFATPDKKHSQKDVSMKLVNIPSFSNNVYQIFAAIAKEEGVEFNYEVSDFHQNKLKTNETYLKRILKNILSNAFKYTEKGSVSFSVYSPSSQELNDIDFRFDGAVAFKVEDTGIGIPKSQQDEIFNRRKRAEHPNANEANGSGLGLNICKQLTESLNGELHMESEVGIGSTFTLYLPAEKTFFEENTVDFTGKKEPVKEETIIGTGATSDKTILIIDDSMVHNLAIKELLSFTFNNCITTTSKTKGYQILKRESIDCIILDYLLVDTESVEMAKYLKNHHLYAHIPIIIYTGKILSNEELKRIQRYTDAIIKKDTNSHKKLISTIHSCLGSNMPVNQ